VFFNVFMVCTLLIVARSRNKIVDIQFSVFFFGPLGTQHPSYNISLMGNSDSLYEVSRDVTAPKVAACLYPSV
jgi:hypothetical protein